VSAKTTKLAGILKRVPRTWEAPKRPADVTVLEFGLVCVLTRHLSAPQSGATLRAIRKAMPDWNEVRVSQIQEFAEHIKSKSEETRYVVARDIRIYLQEVFQQNHGFDLEFLSEDVVQANKFILDLEFFGMAAGHHLISEVCGEDALGTLAIGRILERLGLMPKTVSVKRVQKAMDELVPKGQKGSAGVTLGIVLDAWCEAKKPVCWECPLMKNCAHGGKVDRDWRIQQKRLAEQREREEVRRLRDEERDRKRAARDAERDRKRRATEASKQMKASQKARKDAEAKKAAKKAARAAERKKVAAKKKAASKKKPAAKKTATKKKPAAKKTATKKKSAAKKTVTRKKPAARKKAAKKATTKKKPAAKKTRKK